MDCLKDTGILLEQWSLWSQVKTGINLGFKSSSIFTSDVQTRRQAFITDESANLIDKTVARLIKKDPAMGLAVKFYYFSGENLAYTARKLKIDRNKAKVLVMAGTAYIDGALEFYN